MLFSPSISQFSFFSRDFAVYFAFKLHSNWNYSLQLAARLIFVARLFIYLFFCFSLQTRGKKFLDEGREINCAKYRKRNLKKLVFWKCAPTTPNRQLSLLLKSKLGEQLGGRSKGDGCGGGKGGSKRKEPVARFRRNSERRV